MPAEEARGFPTPNFNSGYYDQFTRPNCTWYCYGRAREIAGKTIKFSRNSGRDAENWWTLVTNCTQSSDPEVNSIAVWKDGPSTVGHVAYVYGAEGPDGYWVYFSDSNWPPRSNTKAYKMPRDEFEGMCGAGNFLGYLVL